MSYRTIIQILLILAIISTICICTLKPQMHKSVMVYNSDYKLVPTQEIEIEQQNIPVMEQPVKPQTSVVKIENQVQPQTTTVHVQPVKITQTKAPVKKTVTTKSQPVKVVQNNIKSAKTNIVQAPKIDTQKILNNNQKILQEKQIQTTSTPVKSSNTQVAKVPVPVQTKTVTTAPKTVTVAQKPAVRISQPTQKVLTAREEEIAWNIWRSNLQNKIMQDTKLPYIPMGTIFRFSFDVDKYGKISNIQTWSDTPKYTPHAIQFVAPVIRSYQGRSILNFPQGTNRTSTKFVGAWKISTSSKYSTPQDYNDIEKIQR